MNWKNITVEKGFVKQEINLSGLSAVNYIPLEQIDSFGVVNSENKLWLYAGIFFGASALLMVFAEQVQPALFMGIICAGLMAVYFLTKKTWFSITSSQTKFLVQVRSTKEEVQAVNTFVGQIKQSIISSEFSDVSKAA